jgi:hypothetical protein
MNKLQFDIHNAQAAIKRGDMFYELRQFGQTLDLTPRKHEADKIYKEAFTMDLLIYDYSTGVKRVAKSKLNGKEIYPVQQ